MSYKHQSVKSGETYVRKRWKEATRCYERAMLEATEHSLVKCAAHTVSAGLSCKRTLYGGAVIVTLSF
jgi:hypothetical protein